jgi:hypothetical protein
MRKVAECVAGRPQSVQAKCQRLLGCKGSKKVVEFRFLKLAQGLGFYLTGCDQTIKLVFRRFQVSCCLLLRERVHYCEFPFLSIVGTTMHQISSPLLAKKEGAPPGNGAENICSTS